MGKGIGNARERNASLANTSQRCYCILLDCQLGLPKAHYDPLHSLYKSSEAVGAIQMLDFDSVGASTHLL